MEYAEKEKRRKARKALGRCICLQDHQRQGPWRVLGFVQVGRCKCAQGVCGLCGEVLTTQVHSLLEHRPGEACAIVSLLTSTLPTLTDSGVAG